MKHHFWKNIGAIAIGSAIGTSLRYYLNLYTLATGYPIGTIIENLGGSLLLGFLTGWFIIKVPREWLKAGLGVGLCGGFTTMSTLASDSVYLFLEHTWWLSVVYILLSIFGGIVCALAGYIVGQKAGKRQASREVEQG
ncbi:fluoride efflux transporter FluC [Halalkalibacter alkaliphilus]|uniref:Fluoride-specific ion channel FluC n=1 Tax=Halalkalibacter alkaliphilus TaxID=2917993 RepID=A0A9X2CV70_9BACI|nr:CrcB family protein [Halalkalibacter alkaliphilus]MCL7748816.1 CrcB family protein [Halalkalibacter alkaliphilus]